MPDQKFNLLNLDNYGKSSLVVFLWVVVVAAIVTVISLGPVHGPFAGHGFELLGTTWELGLHTVNSTNFSVINNCEVIEYLL